MESYRVIDFHCHIFPDNLAPKATQFLSEHYRVPVRYKGTVDELVEYVHEAKIERMVVHSTATKASQVHTINGYIAQQCALHPEMIGFGSLHPDMDDVEKEVARIRELGLHGIKLHPDFQGFKADSDRALRLFEKMDPSLPILIHAGDEHLDNSSPRRIARVVDRFPQLTFIAAHLGGYQMWDEAVEYLYPKDVYIDSSSALWAMTAEQANAYIRAFGKMDHILFGTDYPMTVPQEELGRFFALDLSEKERRAILFENAARLLKLPKTD